MIRSVLAGLVGKLRREIVQEIIEAESKMNSLHGLKEWACSVEDVERISAKIPL